MQRILTDDLKIAIQKNEFYAYLIGEGPYQYPSRYADIPTDTDYVMKAIKDYHNEGHPEIYSLLKENILKMSKDQNFYWFSVYYLDAYLSLPAPDEQQESKSFTETVLKNIAARKNELFDNRQWIGANMKNGLWGAFSYMAKRITEAHPELKIDIGWLG
jgi:hypothetical protein